MVITAIITFIGCWIIRSAMLSSLVTFIDDNYPNQSEDQAYRNAKFCDSVATNAALILWFISLYVFQ